MHNPKISPKEKQLKNSAFLGMSNGIIVLLFIILCFLFFKNISYPLLFNDEAETAMNAQQILKYGYPKAHDEKNTIFITDNPLMLGYKASKDANITIPWGNYYFSVIGVWMAKFTDDIYVKTALIRIPFVTAGLLGLVIFVFAFQVFFSDNFYFKLFFIFFLVVEICSVNLFLHIREARYYSLVIFICSCFFYVFIRKYAFNKYAMNRYYLWMTLVLVIAYNINFIAFVVMCMTLCLFEGLLFCRSLFGQKFANISSNFKSSFVNILPVIFSLILVSPLLVFFETFSTAAKASSYYHYTTDLFWTHVSDIFRVLSKYEILYAALIIKAIHLVCFFAVERKNSKQKSILNYMEEISLFMILFFILFVLMTARIPFIWTRYFIVLQPVIALVILFDSVIILKYIELFVDYKSQKIYKISFLIIVVLVCTINLNKKENHFSDYLYQLSHQYKGPLDEYIPFIKNKYSKPDTLVIATNYEELSYIYYLNCKVVLGYNYGFRNLTEDSLRKYNPDILIFRKKWGQNPFAYNYYIQHGKFERTSFPVVDWPVNNLADLEFFVKHQFKTLITNDEKEKSDIFIRVKNNN